VKSPRSLEALRERTFRPLYGARTISALGDSIASIAIAFAVLELDGTAFELGVILAARTLPTLVCVVPAGVWADRYGRRRVLLASDLVSFAAQAAMAATLIAGTASLAQLFVLQLLYGTASAFFLPASSGVVPDTISPQRLQQAYALLGVSSSAAAVVGPLLAGVIVATAGAGWAIALDAFTFGVSALLLLGLRGIDRARSETAGDFLPELAQGWREVRSRTWIWVSILDFSLFQFLVFSAFYVLGPVIANDSLNGAASWSTIVAANGIGWIAGGVLALRFRPRRPLLVAFATSLVFAPALVLLGAAAPTWAIAGAWAAGGIAAGLGQTLWETTLQEKIPGDMRSRVSAYDWLGSLAIRPLGYAVAGPVGALFGSETTFVAAAVGLVLVTGTTLCVPSVRQLTRGGPREAPVTVVEATEG
jgi:MFS family permease